MKISRPQAVLYVQFAPIDATLDTGFTENSFTVWDLDNVCFCKCKAVFKENSCYVIWKAKHVARKKVRNFEISY